MKDLFCGMLGRYGYFSAILNFVIPSTHLTHPDEGIPIRGCLIMVLIPTQKMITAELHWAVPGKQAMLM
jgi:hypothetical protein